MRRAREFATIVPVVCALAPFAAGCTDDARARRQLVVWVDTDLPVPDQIAEDSELAADAAIDTLRVDVLWDDASVGLSQVFVAPEVDSWPLSFGIVDAPAAVVGLRLRVFRGALAHGGEVAGAATLDPDTGVAVDRFVRVRFPSDDRRDVTLVLEGDCWGRAAVFGAQPTTCIGGADVAVGEDQGVLEGAPSGHAVGTWAHARAKACGAGSTTDAACLAGGFALLGDRSLAGVADTGDLLDSAPLCPLVMSPFRMDRTEYSVGRLRQMVQSGQYSGELPLTPSAGLDADCTWLGLDDPAADGLPVTCVSFAAARAICQASGGDLPSEAQWEFAARGRGARRFYPWGDTPPTCCTGVFSRPVSGELGALCEGPIVEPVNRERVCDGDTDVSRDGIFDLAGNVREQVLDAPLPFTHACWKAPGILFDPECHDAEEKRNSLRGGSGIVGMARAFSALRQITGLPEGFRGEGFRCVYPGN